MGVSSVVVLGVAGGGGLAHSCARQHIGRKLRIKRVIACDCRKRVVEEARTIFSRATDAIGVHCGIEKMIIYNKHYVLGYGIGSDMKQENSNIKPYSNMNRKREDLGTTPRLNREEAQ